MLPGIWPSLLLGGPEPIINITIEPFYAAWLGTVFNYHCQLTVQHQGGVAPFSYLWWTTGGDAVIANPTASTVQLTSVTGETAQVSCRIIDAVGQEVTEGKLVHQQGL